MSPPSTIGVNNDLTACKSSITMRPTNHESARWIEISCNLVIGYSLIMLSRDEDCMNPDRNHSTTVIVVLNGNLGLSIRSQPWAGAIFANFSETGTKLGCKHMAKGHQFWRLIGSIAKHVTLVTGTNFLRPLCEVTIVTHDFLIVYLGFCGDLTKYHNHVGFGASLTSNFAVRVLLKAGIKHCIRDLITKLVRVSLIDRLRSE
ncbi:hypothetical protein RJ641_004442 [Dillenia turbinata]|uniref:Uncharacterized protein n=1 Tax=Dillenia turbinata TaxID=194707 RepID=A0AAN8ZE22_9MAGN